MEFIPVHVLGSAIRTTNTMNVYMPNMLAIGKRNDHMLDFKSSFFDVECPSQGTTQSEGSVRRC